MFARDTTRTSTTIDEPLSPADEVDDMGTGTRIHVVTKGDTLYRLARQYYGDQKKWRAIWEANSTLVTDPNKLYVGMKLVIP